MKILEIKKGMILALKLIKKACYTLYKVIHFIHKNTFFGFLSY